MTKRRTHRRQHTRLGPEANAILRFGRNFFADGPDLADIADLETVWNRNRDQLLADHSRRPGTRPWGYWKFDVGLEIPLGTTPSRAVPELLRMSEVEYLDRNNLLSGNERTQLPLLLER